MSLFLQLMNLSAGSMHIHYIIVLQDKLGGIDVMFIKNEVSKWINLNHT